MTPWLLALAFLAAPARADESAWQTAETPHFVIHREKPGAALGDYTSVERIYDGLRPTLWSLVPWMASEKTHLYLYADRASYAKGRFHPPGWSAGLLADGGERAVAVYEPLDTTVVAHELTHLYFHSFFAQTGARAPAWLDEGLAGMLQDEALTLPDPRRRGPVLKAPTPLERFLAQRPAADAPGAWVGAWYRQAASVVWFLKRGKMEAQFDDFCRRLRDGQATDEAVRGAFGYDSLAALDRDWRQWRPKKEVGEPVGLDDR